MPHEGVELNNPSPEELTYGRGYLDEKAVSAGGNYAQMYLKAKAQPEEDGSNEMIAKKKNPKAQIVKPTTEQAKKASERLAARKTPAYTPNGGPQTMNPGSYPKNRLTNSADSTQMPDTKTTDDCKFVPDNTAKDQQKMIDDKKWSNPGMGNGGGGGGNGNGGGGLPQLPQIPQGGGNKNSNPTNSPVYRPTPTPVATRSMPDGVSCLVNNAPVCGEDGKTYMNLCFAQHSTGTSVPVIHSGACEKVSNNSEVFENLNTIVQNMVTSGVPMNIVTQITEALTRIISNVWDK